MMTSAQARVRRYEDPATQHICQCLLGAYAMLKRTSPEAGAIPDFDSPEGRLTSFFIKLLPEPWLALPAPQGETAHDA